VYDIKVLQERLERKWLCMLYNHFHCTLMSYTRSVCVSPLQVEDT